MARLGRIFFAAAVVAIFVIQTTVAGESVEEILEKNGLPKGLLPGTVKSFSLSDDGKFEVTLTSTCTTKIDTEDVYYKKKITGQLSYGKITNLSGIQAKEFFWVSISAIEVDKSNPDIIWFEVGFLSKSLSKDIFDVPPTCNSLAGQEGEAITFSKWVSKALDGAFVVKLPRNLDVLRVRKILQ